MRLETLDLARRAAAVISMTLDVAGTITAAYAICNSLRLVFYVPQWVAVARDKSAARTISMISWTFWILSHAVTAIYCFVIVEDELLGAMMLGNAAGCAGVLAITIRKRIRFPDTMRRPMSRLQAFDPT